MKSNKLIRSDIHLILYFYGDVGSLFAKQDSNYVYLKFEYLNILMAFMEVWRMTMDDLDEIDKKILNTIQSHFPVHPHPYLILAEQMGISEGEALKRVEGLRSKGVIRRIGAVFNSSSLGFQSTLVGVKVDPKCLEKVAKRINSLSGITHHYQREDAFNLWFTLTAEDSKIIDRIVEQIKAWEGVVDILNLPSTRTFKIKVDFQI